MADRLVANTDDSSRGIQCDGSYTCRTPTTALIPLHTSRIASSRTSWRGRLIAEGTQKIEQNTAKYRNVCATPAVMLLVRGCTIIADRQSITKTSQRSDG